MARAASRRRTTRLAVLIGGAIVAVFVLVFVAGQFVGDDDAPSDTVVPGAPADTAGEAGGATEGTDAAAADGSSAVTTPVAEPATGTATASSDGAGDGG